MSFLVAFGIVLLAGLIEPAFAEVCDKFAPDWKPGDSPIRMKDPAYVEGVLIFGTIGLAVIGVLAACRWIWGSWNAIFPAIALLGGGYSALLYMLFDEDSTADHAYLAGIKEGCISAFSSPVRYVWLVVLAIFLAALVIAMRYPRLRHH